MDNFKIRSEVGQLKAVLLHRPSAELEKLTPEHLEELLFDDIPWLVKMQAEHDGFASVLKDNGVKIFYIQDMLEEVLTDIDKKSFFINELLHLYSIDESNIFDILSDYLKKQDATKIADIAISGLTKKELPATEITYSLSDYVKKDYPLYINPLPNMYCTRDIGAVVWNSLIIGSMFGKARKAESFIFEFVQKNHPIFSTIKKIHFGNNKCWSLEGGDIMVLNEEVIAIGCSQRTSAAAIEILSADLFEFHPELKEILVIHIPNARTYMHLDTVMTMIDVDKFNIYGGIFNSLKLYRLTRSKNSQIKISPEKDLLSTLKKSLKVNAVSLIESGGNDLINAAREQWNDSTNTLALSPGLVIAYNRNEKSNEVLRRNGIRVIEINGSELVRGRGGPRCICLPLSREDIG